MRDVETMMILLSLAGLIKLDLKLVVSPLEPFDFDGDGVAETTYTLTQNSIVSNSFSIDSASQCGSNVEVGACIASELKFTLRNTNNVFNGAKFEGAEIAVYGVVYDEEDPDNTTEIKLGKFTVDEHPRMGALISINALDRMAQFDKVIPQSSALWAVTTARYGIDVISQECNVELGTYRKKTGTNRYTNTIYANDYFNNNLGGVSFSYNSAEPITYRQALQFLCQIACCNSYCNYDGKLCFRWYGMSNHVPRNTLVSLTPSIDPTTSFQIQLDENDIRVATLSVVKSDGTVVSYTPPIPPENGIEIRIENNPYADAVANINTLQYLYNNRFLNFSYRPFSATTLPYVSIEPHDAISVTDKYGNEAETYAMNVTYKLNGKTSVSAKGESAVKTGYAALNYMTAEERRVLEGYQRNIKANEDRIAQCEEAIQTFDGIPSNIGNIEQAAVNFNLAMMNGVGLHQSVSDGVTYYHDAPTLSGSKYIMKQNSAGIAWTSSGWNGNNTVYEYGISSGGAALLQELNTYRINAELISCDNLLAISANLGGWTIENDNISKSEMYGNDRYKAYLQPPGYGDPTTPFKDRWLLSSQIFENDGSVGSPLFYLTHGGKAYFKEWVTSDVGFRHTGGSINMGVEFTRGLVGNIYSVAMSIKDGFSATSTTDARLDIFRPGGNIVGLRTYHNQGTAQFGFLGIGRDVIKCGPWFDDKLVPLKASDIYWTGDGTDGSYYRLSDLRNAVLINSNNITNLYDFYNQLNDAHSNLVTALRNAGII